MLGEELKRLRAERGLGMKRLAELSDVSRQHLYAIQSGDNEHPFPETLLKLATGLSAWRDGVSDPDDYSDVLRRLQVAAGYSADAPQAMLDGDAVTTPIPEPLAESLLEIIESWPRWSQAERETAARLLDVASDIGRPDPPTMAHEDHSESRNGITGFVSIKSSLEDTRIRVQPRIPSRIASAPTRELALAGR